MSSDGSTGRREGFDRWVASMKREQQPMQEKPASLKAMDKLELDLDENATHVHRIPKDLINRLREQRAQEQQASRTQAAAATAAREPAPARPAQVLPVSEEQVAHAFEQDDIDVALGGVSDDRTAVFRPPPELLARAKRMKPPTKPNVTSELPTKPPPGLGAADLGAGAPNVPAAARLPGFDGAAAVASASNPALDEPFRATAPREPAPAALADAAVLPEQPISSPDIERSAVFAQSEPTSGVMSLGLPEVPPVAEESSRVVALMSEEPVAPLMNDALLLAVAPPAVETAAVPESDDDAPAPTTTSPLVRSERSQPPEAAPVASPRLLIWLFVALATAAFVFWRLRHGH
jgi:hypothetical protein